MLFPAATLFKQKTEPLALETKREVIQHLEYCYELYSQVSGLLAFQAIYLAQARVWVLELEYTQFPL
jgi:hypothetical protein